MQHEDRGCQADVGPSSAPQFSEHPRCPPAIARAVALHALQRGSSTVRPHRTRRFPNVGLDRATRMAPFQFLPLDRKLNPNFWKRIRSTNLDRLVRKD